MQTIEVVKATDTFEKVSDKFVSEILLTITDTQSKEMVWVEQRENGRYERVGT
jgi:hypothetical protein